MDAETLDKVADVIRKRADAAHHNPDLTTEQRFAVMSALRQLARDLEVSAAEIRRKR